MTGELVRVSCPRRTVPVLSPSTLPSARAQSTRSRPKTARIPDEPKSIGNPSRRRKAGLFFSIGAPMRQVLEAGDTCRGWPDEEDPGCMVSLEEGACIRRDEPFPPDEDDLPTPGDVRVVRQPRKGIDRYVQSTHLHCPDFLDEVSPAGGMAFRVAGQPCPRDAQETRHDVDDGTGCSPVCWSLECRPEEEREAGDTPRRLERDKLSRSPPNAASMHAPLSNWQTVLSGLTERTMFPSSHPEPRTRSSSFLTASFRISISLHLPWVPEQDPARRPIQPFQPEGERHHPVVSRPDRREVEELDHRNAATKQRAMDRPVPGKRFD